MTDQTPSRSPAVSDRAADMVALRRIIRELMVRDEPAFVEQRIDNFLTAIERAGWGLFLTGNMAALASRPSPERRTADAVLALLDDYANNPASATNVAAMAERIAIEVRSLTDKTNADPSPPAGEWQWVPKKITGQMEGAFDDALPRRVGAEHPNDRDSPDYRALARDPDALQRCWTAMLSAAPPPSAPAAREWQKRPVAFRVKNRAGEWCLFQHEEIAQAAANHLGVEYQGLYARASAPVGSGEREET